jgi:hypothetical protein
MEATTTSRTTRAHEQRQWHIYKAIEHLKVAPRTAPHQIALANPIVRILTIWADSWTGEPKWQSVLDKRTFLHEVEESMVALYYLDRWRGHKNCQKQQQEEGGTSTSFVAVDVCGGKGIFSMLLQFMAALYWNKDGGVVLDQIILIEKATSKQIDWSHLKERAHNNFEETVVLPSVHIWEGVNLHDHDYLVDRFKSRLSPSTPLALIGIHLCKLLSPAMISLVNLLGHEWCQHVCLAPCCMPRAVVSKYMPETLRGIPIFGFETSAVREGRLQMLQYKRLLQRKGRDNGTLCFLCASPDHWLDHCPQFADKSAAEKSQLLQEAAATSPCWKCGVVGHFRSDCVTTKDKKAVRKSTSSTPPVSMTVHVATVLSSPCPFLSYCQLLAPSGEPPD